MKRYDFDHSYYHLDVYERDDGEWVKYEDADKEITELDDELNSADATILRLEEELAELEPENDYSYGLEAWLELEGNKYRWAQGMTKEDSIQGMHVIQTVLDRLKEMEG